MTQKQPIEPAIPPIVNDFNISFSTVNGSGSATANLTLMRAIFKMGIPVSGKNIFPSNIQGLPTWFMLRVNKDGFTARTEKNDIVVAMNVATFAQEVKSVAPGGALFYSDQIRAKIERDDIVVYPMPIQQLIIDKEVPKNLRSYISNMVYVGILAGMLGITLESIQESLDFQFKGSKKALDSNMDVIRTGFDWAKTNLEKKDPFFVEPMEKTKGCILGNANTAAALGAIYGGVQFVSWYPITPATSIAESLNEYLPQLRKDPETGKDTFVVIQAEDELAAVGNIIGAGWAGLRSMTCTSGPGISLMSEFLGMAYYVEVPLVIWDVQRVGPSTGLPTRTAQGDLTSNYFISHGDTNYIFLFPGTLKECFEFGWKAFDIAERLQTPVIVMTDLDMGMNHWMSDAFEYPDKPMDRGKVLWEKDLEEMLAKRNGDWGRYLDIDGDAIPYRTVVGNKHPRSAYFARGTGHDPYTRYSEAPDVWEKGLARLKKKFETAKQYLPKSIVCKEDDTRIGILAFGSTDSAIVEALHLMKKDNVKTDYLRLRAIPFGDDVNEFLENHDRIYIVEVNRDGQMMQLLTINFPQYASRFISVAKMDGLPLTAQFVCHSIMAQEGK